MACVRSLLSPSLHYTSPDVSGPETYFKPEAEANLYSTFLSTQLLQGNVLKRVSVAGRRYPNSLLRNWEAWSSLHPSVPPLLRGALGLQGSEEPKGVECPKCGRHYKLKSSLRNHQKWECGKEPQFQCPYCNYRAKQKMHVARHIERMHREKLDILESIHDRSIKEDSSLYQQDTV
ncbi:hypothetical protein J6590_002318 [Homalodisca vitripennis]|nr:hypothetical protein J6590_002318 [Homalodisca vitripennis]